MPAQDSNFTLFARGLSRKFGSHTAVEAIDLELKRGQVLGFLGPNGAGKTTTMQMVTGNLAPSTGSIEICGIDLFEHPASAKARIGYLPEIPPVYPELTVDEYLHLAVKLHRVPRPARRGAVARAKQRCGLGDCGRKLIGTLSKGYQQRVGIAQAIAHEPDIVILDEPTVGLDPNQIREIRRLIRELGGEHSVILCTHVLPEVEAVCDEVRILHHGRLVYRDSIAGLKAFHSGSAVLLGLRHPPEPAALGAIPGIARVENMAPTLFRLHFENGTDPLDEIVARSAANGWRLYQLAPAHARLEDVFVHLTRSEEQPA